MDNEIMLIESASDRHRRLNTIKSGTGSGDVTTKWKTFILKLLKEENR